ncbi:uncharacterized protein LOC131626927 [Vicia villosa]|uniref:uncharacterized protein LOC131626927 n=1 Tax=Vicia villosa TaxID=3911 RepID=UPI00273BE0A6|nr:uncharacterized protein LOC131626927 [Vicia villosa]
MRQIPLSKRSTYRALSNSLNIPKTSLIRLHKSGVIRRHSSTLKPYLKEDNMINHLRFCKDMLDSSSLPHDLKFLSMHNIVFIDEKWFYITKTKNNYYLLRDEEEPHRTCKRKNFIGKIGIFPFVYEQPAKRSSVNRVAGTIERKPISYVTREVNKAFLISKVLPTIKSMWPREDVGKTIYIKQGNARSHIAKSDPDFCRAASEDGFDIQMTCQPLNSVDLNVLDLEFFNAIQSLQQQEPVNSIDELIDAVQRAFDEFSCQHSDKFFSTLQSCMIEIMKIKGSNKYKIPHMKKDMLYNQSCIPTQLSCDSSLVQEVTEYLQHFDV